MSFVQKLADLLPDYDIACEHEHSNCVLIAHTKVKGLGLIVELFVTLFICCVVAQLFIDGHWHTWIDYSKFHLLVSHTCSDLLINCIHIYI